MAENTKIQWRDQNIDIRQCEAWAKGDSKTNYAERMSSQKGRPRLKKKEAESG